MSIAENLEFVKKEIYTTAKKCGRNPDDITLVAVSKTVGVDQIEEAIQTGMKDFGENRVQELVGKREKIVEDVKWHQIGRLQTNKVKYLIGKDVLIHSLDRMELAVEIARLSEKKGLETEVLIQINVSEEDTKAGIRVDEVDAFLDQLAVLKGINVVGLMTIAQNTVNFDEIRQVFSKLREIYIDIQNERIDNNIQMKYLSMGMSHDYQIAIEEGSNMLRIGTLIFGER
ncbi:MAG: YggS family pyridoxal phosphate-dependent enzyme [Clostridia bacterium]